MNYVVKKTPPFGAAGAESAFPGGNSNRHPTQPAAANQAAFADLAEIKRDSVWRLAHIAQEHLDRLLWSIEHDDDAEVRDQCRSLVAHVRAVAILVNDLRDGGGR
jgi:hypothetical protein